MKKTFLKSSKLLLAVLISLLLASCHDDKDEANPQDMIKYAWRVTRVTQDGNDVTGSYVDLRLTFTDGVYTTTNAHKLFFPSGTWNWSGTGVTDLTLDNALLISVAELRPAKLNIRFTLDVSRVNTSGKNLAVIGKYDLVFER